MTNDIASMSIHNKVQKYLPASEQIHSIICAEPFWGNEETLYVATQQRLGILYHKGWFSYQFVSIGWEDVISIAIKEAMLKCEGQIRTRIPDPDTGESVLMRIKDISKPDARHFVSVVTQLIDENREISAYRTKTCSVCDETVKWKAIVCKHYGNAFL